MIRERIQSPRSMMAMYSLIVAPKKSNSYSKCLFVLLTILQRTASVSEFLGSFQHGFSSTY